MPLPGVVNMKKRHLNAASAAGTENQLMEMKHLNKPEPVYQSEVKCPACEKDFEITKVRSRSIRALKYDTDFCPYYEGENPLFYEAVVCPHCGFASHITDLGDLNRIEKQKIREFISKRWKPRSFSGRRTWDNALEAFKLVLLNLNMREAPQSEIAKICIRIAWLYRYAGDSELEQCYLNHALNSYRRAYEEEDLNDSRLDPFTMLFIIGELYARTGRNDEALQWFSRLIREYSDPKNRGKIPVRLIETTRDRVQELRQNEKMKSEVN